VRYRYVQKSTGYPSNPSPQVTYDAPGLKEISVSGMIPSTDARVDKIILEMTVAGGSEFFQAAEVDNDSTGTIDVSDTALAAAILDYGQDDDHEVPPVGRLIAYHKGLMFVGGPEDHEAGTASCVGSTVAVTFAGADIRASLAGGYFRKGTDAKAYLISAVASTGDAGELTLAEAYPSSFSAQAYKCVPNEPNLVYVGKGNYPEAFDAERHLRVLQGRADRLVAMAPYKSALLFFGRFTLEMLVWEADPIDGDDGRLYCMSNERGAVCQESVVLHNDVVYAMDPKGVYLWAGGNPQDLGGPIQDYLDAIDWSYQSKFHGYWDPSTREIVFHVCNTGETEPYTAFAWHPERKEWRIRTYERAISASDVLPDANGFQRPFLGTEDGATWFAGIGYTDGVYPGTTCKGTVVTGATATAVGILEKGLYASGQKLKGVSAYWVEGQQSMPVSDNTTEALTIVSPGFSSAPAGGDTICLGRIYSRRKSKRFRLGPPPLDYLPVYLHLDFTALASAATLVLKVYENGSAVAKTDWEANTAVEGVTFQAGNPEILVDLTTTGGHVKVPLGAVWRRDLEFEFIVDEPAVQLELLGYYLEMEGERVPGI